MSLIHHVNVTLILLLKNDCHQKVPSFSGDAVNLQRLSIIDLFSNRRAN